MIALGGALLWFGWFGFNAGSALTVDSVTVLAFANTQLAASFGAMIWLLIEWRREGKPTLVGFITGAIAGLVAITPAAGFVSTGSSVLIGLASGMVCYAAVELKNRLNWDDALDVWGVHGVGGILGSIAVGIFATTAVNPGITNGLLDGGYRFFGIQVLGVVIACVYSFVMTLIILKVINQFMKVKVTESEEDIGLDKVHHGEEAYSFRTQ